jgi:hypothetical protein
MQNGTWRKYLQACAWAKPELTGIIAECKHVVWARASEWEDLAIIEGLRSHATRQIENRADDPVHMPSQSLSVVIGMQAL